MTCNLCYDLCEIFKGNPLQSIGSVDNLNAQTIAFITNLGTGRTEAQDITTTGTGEVNLDFSVGYLEHGQTYRVQLSLLEYGSDFLLITPPEGVTEYPCIMFTIRDVC